MFTEKRHGVGRSATLIGQLFCLQFSSSLTRGWSRILHLTSAWRLRISWKHGVVRVSNSISFVPAPGGQYSVTMKWKPLWIDRRERSKDILVMNLLQLLFALRPPLLFLMTASTWSGFYSLVAFGSLRHLPRDIDKFQSFYYSDEVRLSVISVYFILNSFFFANKRIIFERKYFIYSILSNPIGNDKRSLHFYSAKTQAQQSRSAPLAKLRKKTACAPSCQDAGFPCLRFEGILRKNARLRACCKRSNCVKLKF